MCPERVPAAPAASIRRAVAAEFLVLSAHRLCLKRKTSPQVHASVLTMAGCGSAPLLVAAPSGLSLLPGARTFPSGPAVSTSCVVEGGPVGQGQMGRPWEEAGPMALSQGGTPLMGTSEPAPRK